jgi:hypothetical protein
MLLGHYICCKVLLFSLDFREFKFVVYESLYLYKNDLFLHQDLSKNSVAVTQTLNIMGINLLTCVTSMTIH